ncbi:MAG: hypothetical protein L6R38_008683 [Xanthoria sp. 2 TBL-2021]|nr:MAG: hypothetical protein L6R38_008683 [Xanthoria sp. 2 TBL-2021]
MSFNVAPLEVGKARKLSQGRKLSYISEHGADFEPYSDPAGVPASIPDIMWKPSPRLYLAFLTLAVITMMVALDGTSLSVALPIISEDLGGTAIEAFWSGTSFLLCSTIFQPSFASFSHIFGRKPMILTGLVFFLIGAIIAAVARNFAVLLAGRSLQGIGGGGLIALTEIVVADLVPLRLRGQWFGLISAMWALGSVSGPIIGGAFAQGANWRWIFWINLPFIGIAFVFVPLFLKLAFKPSSFTAQLARVDWFGSFLFIASTTSFLIPITWGGVSYPWTSWHTLVPLCLGIAGLITFITYEEIVATEPLIRLVIFKNRTAAVSYIATVIHGMILWSLLYYLPLYYEAVKGFSPIISGVALFPETFTVAPASVVVGILITVTGRYRWAIWAGWVLTVLGTGLLYLLDVDTSTVSWIFINLVGGLGMGMLFPSMAFAIQASQTNEDLAFAIAMFSFFRAFGQAIGVAIGGTVFQNQMKSKLLAYPALASKAEEFSKDASSLVQIIKSMQDDAMKQNLRHAYADSLKVVWATMCGLAAVGLILSLGTKGLDMNKPLETEQYFLDERNTTDEEKK